MTEELRESEMICLLKKININLEICLEKRLKGSGMSGTQVYFLVYILRHHPKGTYITEMCRETGDAVRPCQENERKRISVLCGRARRYPEKESDPHGEAFE